MSRLVLIPGMAADARVWQPQLDALSRRIAVTVADVHERFATLPEMASALIEEAEGALLVCGTSMGGYIALEVLRQAPARVAGLALLDTSARADAPEATERRLEAIAAVERDQFERVATDSVRRAVHPDRVDDGALMDTLLACYRRTGPALFVRQMRAVMARPDSRALLPMIRCPTLVVCGADDQVTPVALSREIATLIPGARHVEIAHCGHVATLEQPDIVNDALGAWLSDCLARRDGIPAVVAPP